MKLNIQLFAVSKSTSFSESNLNPTANTSTLNITIYFSPNNNQTYFNSKTLYCTCNGVSQSANVKLSKGGSVSKTFTFDNIEHESDGSKTISWSWNISTGTSVLGNLSDSGSYTLTRLHIPPAINSVSFTEQNASLLNVGVSNTQFVNNLSQKEFTANITLSDSATLYAFSISATDLLEQSTNIFNIVKPSATDKPSGTGTFSFTRTLDFNNQEITNYSEISGKYYSKFKYSIADILNGGITSATQGWEQANQYEVIPYFKPTLISSATNVKRNGQTSGKAKLTINGTFFNDDVGNTRNTISIQYKFWNKTSSESQTLYTIPNANISVSGNTFSVSNYEIGTIDETAANYFDPDNAYFVQVYVNDTFVSGISLSTPLSIFKGEAVWTEYLDRVDFKKTTINGGIIILNGDGTIICNSKSVAVMKELYSNTSGATSVNIGEDTGNYNFYIISWGAGYSEKGTDIFIPNFGNMRLTFSSTGAWELVYNFSNSGNYINMSKHSTTGWGDIGKMFKIIGVKF